MEKLFGALRSKHPGFDVRDVKFVVNLDEINGQKAADLDAGLAEVVKNAEILTDASALCN